MRTGRLFAGFVSAFLAFSGGLPAAEISIQDGGYVNLNSTGATRYDAYASIDGAADDWMYATVNLLGAGYTLTDLYAYNIYLTVEYTNIRKVNNVWRAERIDVRDTYGNLTVLREVTLSASGYVECNVRNGNTYEVLNQSSITLTYEPPPPPPPRPSARRVAAESNPGPAPYLRVFAEGVSHATEVQFDIYSIEYGTADRFGYPAADPEGDNTWKAVAHYRDHEYSIGQYVVRAYGKGKDGQWYYLGGTYVTLRGVRGASTPCFEPQYWDDPAIKPHNNCYAYANNKVVGHFAFPGVGGGRPCNAYTVEEINAGAIADGLEPAGNNDDVPAGKALIAIFIDPDRDFHCYRLDCDGTWSHKPGIDSATNRDNSGQVITDPESADRGSYTVLVGYYLTPSGGPEQGQGEGNID